jgi:hypothetical protein
MGTLVFIGLYHPLSARSRNFSSIISTNFTADASGPVLYFPGLGFFEDIARVMVMACLAALFIGIGNWAWLLRQRV